MDGLAVVMDEGEREGLFRGPRLRRLVKFAEPDPVIPPLMVGTCLRDAQFQRFLLDTTCTSPRRTWRYISLNDKTRRFRQILWTTDVGNFQASRHMALCAGDPVVMYECHAFSSARSQIWFASEQVWLFVSISTRKLGFERHKVYFATVTHAMSSQPATHSQPDTQASTPLTSNKLQVVSVGPTGFHRMKRPDSLLILTHTRS